MRTWLIVAMLWCSGVARAEVWEGYDERPCRFEASWLRLCLNGMLPWRQDGWCEEARILGKLPKAMQASRLPLPPALQKEDLERLIGKTRRVLLESPRPNQCREAYAYRVAAEAWRQLARVERQIVRARRQEARADALAATPPAAVKAPPKLWLRRRLNLPPKRPPVTRVLPPHLPHSRAKNCPRMTKAVLTSSAFSPVFCSQKKIRVEK